MGLLHHSWMRLKDFSGLHGDATHLWPRWLVIRAVGLVYLFVFWNVIRESPALIGPSGILPAVDLMKHLGDLFPHSPEAFIRAPSLLWLGGGEGMIRLLGWAGMMSALAVVLNLWPRMMLFACWSLFLSFISFFTIFSSTVIDQLMLEVALLCIPYAPRGFRPGLGEDSPPRPVVLFMVRFLLIRVMFESGFFKIYSGDVRWRDFTAMDVMYETAPFPTFLGYLDHQLSHAYHLGEVALTFVAELVAPVLAIFGGRRGRWFALIAWTMLQGGIQLTANFGWLNTAAIGLGLVLLDDQMLVALARRCRLERLARIFAAAKPNPIIGGNVWCLRGLRVALWAHLGLALYSATLSATHGSMDLTDPGLPLRYAFRNFRSTNTYTPYATFTPERIGVEFLGSNDGGTTWRPYEYHQYPQATGHICGFIAPRFLRFEATMQVIATLPERAPTLSLIALKLLERDPLVTGLFARDPFENEPAGMIRMRRYQLEFTDWATYRQTGDFWTKRYLDDYAPMLSITPDGGVKQAESPLEMALIGAEQGNPAAQNYLGSLYLSGEGVPRDVRMAERLFLLAAEKNLAGAEFNLGVLYAEGERANPAEAARWFRRAAEQGLAPAQYALGWMLEEGGGIRRNPAEALQWYRRAAEQGGRDAQFRLGVNYYQGNGAPRDEVEALAWFALAARAGDEDAAANQAVLENQLDAKARQAARDRIERYAKVVERNSAGR